MRVGTRRQLAELQEFVEGADEAQLNAEIAEATRKTIAWYETMLAMPLDQRCPPGQCLPESSRQKIFGDAALRRQIKEARAHLAKR